MRLLVLLGLVLAVADSVAAAPDLRFLAEPLYVRRDRAGDLIWGQDARGPYSLSRRQIIPGSDVVYLEGARAFRLTDYQIDYTTGTVTFSRIVRRGQSARVEYTFDPKRSPRSVQPFSAPLTLSLGELHVGPVLKTAFKFNGIWRMPEDGQPDIAAIGMGMEGQVGKHTRFGSLLAYTPGSAREGQAANDLDAMGVQVSAETNARALQARLGFLRAGRAFGAAKDYNWKKGAQVLDFTTAYTFSKAVSARAAYQRAQELGEGGAVARTTTTMTNEVTAALSDSSRLTLGHGSQGVEAPEKPVQTTTTERLQLDQRLGRLGTAQVRREIMVATEGDASRTTATTGVKVDALVPGGTRIAAERVEARTDKQDPAVATKLALSTAVPGGALRLEGQLQQKDAPRQPRDEMRAARIEASPVTGVKLGGGVAQRQTGTDQQVQKDAVLELSPDQRLRVVGRVSSQEDGTGRPLAMWRSVDARLQPSKTVEILGLYKEREQQSQPGPLTHSLKVSVAPMRYLQVTGAVTHNPEDAAGKVSLEERRSVGLRSTLGSVTLSGDYARRLSPTATTLAREMELAMVLQLTQHDRFFGGYKLAEQLAASPELASTAHYRLGYSRSLGSTFGLSLEAEYLRYMEGQRLLRDKNEARAKAALNARF